MQLAELAELRTGVEVAITDLAAERIDDEGVAGLHEALLREERGTDAEQAEVVHSLHAAVAAAAQNRVLQLVALVLIRLSRLHQIERLAPKARGQIRAEVLRTHVGIANAVEVGRPRAGPAPHAPAPRGARRPHALSWRRPHLDFPSLLDIGCVYENTICILSAGCCARDHGRAHGRPGREEIVGELG